MRQLCLDASRSARQRTIDTLHEMAEIDRVRADILAAEINALIGAH
jgi:hypothetical protein